MNTGLTSTVLMTGGMTLTPLILVHCLRRRTKPSCLPTCIQPRDAITRGATPVGRDKERANPTDGKTPPVGNITPRRAAHTARVAGTVILIPHPGQLILNTWTEHPVFKTAHKASQEAPDPTPLGSAGDPRISVLEDPPNTGVTQHTSNDIVTIRPPRACGTQHDSINTPDTRILHIVF